MPLLCLSTVTRLEETPKEGTMSCAPACGEQQAPRDAQPTHGFIPQQHRGQECHTIHKTSAQGKARASFILELVQGHRLLVTLDINHTIAFETSVRPSAYPGMSPQGRSQGGDTFRGHAPTLGTHCRPTAWRGSPLGRSAPGPGGSHCHLEVPWWHCLAACTSTLHPLCPPGWQSALCPPIPQGVGSPPGLEQRTTTNKAQIHREKLFGFSSATRGS